MRIVRTIAEVRETLAPARAEGRRIGLVPTMGAFHEGHLALIRAARSASDVLVVSLFVNPTQFDEASDLQRYPRDEAADAALAEREGVDLLFAPSPDELYPRGFDTWVEPGGLATVLEGAARPGHFRGVATVCTKLFAIVAPHAAWFGQKDAQQVAVIRRVVRDLDLPLEIVAVPTVRDADGLALSSRNRFLSSDERRAALVLPRALEAGAAAHAAGRDAVEAAREVLASEPTVTVDYVAVAEFDVPTLVAAVRIGATRLIDNVRLA
ncbi:MAG TPA: pantoate--beta-alanine ligase [Candidatus Limnocylindria bacterium]|nr:pantoate--beta-alanine ligase [Candidatus Limnocylindria bacterium]